MRRRARSATSTTRKSRRNASPRRPRRRAVRNERDDHAPDRARARRGGIARRLRRRGATRAEAGARSAPQGPARAGRSLAAGEALRAGPVHGRGPGRPVPGGTHRSRAGGRRALDQQARARPEPAQGAAGGLRARVDPDGRQHQPGEGDLRPGEGGTEPLPGEKRQLLGTELRRHHHHRRVPDRSQGAGTRQRRRVGGASQRAATAGDQTMKTMTVLHAIALWLAGVGLALAQANSIEAFDVVQQGGNVVVRITTKEPLKSVPPNFAVASPARIAFDFANTVNALGRTSQDIGQGELRSMNLVQGADRSRLVLNLRRTVAHEATLEGRTLVVTLSTPAGAQAAPGGQVARFAEGRADATHAIRDIDFRRGRPPGAPQAARGGQAAPFAEGGAAAPPAIRDIDFRRGPAGEGRVIIDLSDTSTGIDIRQQGQNLVIDFLKTSLDRK